MPISTYSEGVGVKKGKRGRKPLPQSDKLIRFSIGLTPERYQRVNKAAKKASRPLSVECQFLIDAGLEYEDFLRNQGINLAREKMIVALQNADQEIEEVEEEQILEELKALDRSLLRTIRDIRTQASELGYEIDFQLAREFYNELNLKGKNKVMIEVEDKKNHILKKAEEKKGVEKVVSMDSFIRYLKKEDLANSPQMILAEAQRFGIEVDFSRCSELYKEIKLQSLFK